MRVHRSLRNAFLSVITLVVLFGLIGTAYTLLAGGTGPEKAPDKPKKAPVDYSLPKPPKPSAKAPVGVSVGSLLSPVKAGSNTSMTVRTVPGARCSLSVVYDGVASTDSGLAAKTADDYGTVTWSWTVEPAVTAGNWPVKATCDRNGKSGVVQASLKVTR